MVAAAVVSPSLGALLSCDQPNFTCPGTRISCRCEEALVSLSWRIRPTPGSVPVFSASFFESATENETSDGVYTAVVCDVTKVLVDNIMINSYTSKLNFVLVETVTVVCDDNGEASDVLLQRARRLRGFTLEKWRDKI